MNDQPLTNALKVASQNTLHQVILEVCVEPEDFGTAVRRHLVSPKKTVRRLREQEGVQYDQDEYSVKRLRFEKEGEKGDREERNWSTRQPLPTRDLMSLWLPIPTPSPTNSLLNDEGSFNQRINKLLSYSSTIRVVVSRVE